MGMYPIKINTLESKIHIHAFFFSSLHICLLRHEAVWGSSCMSPSLKINGLCIHTDTWVYIIFFIEARQYDSSVTGPSVHTLRDSACLSAPLKWSCLVRQTVKGWGQGLSRNAALCVLFVKINHLDKDIWREFILNSCKSKLLCVDWWCNRTTPQVWTWSSSRTREWRKFWLMRLTLMPPS